MSASEEAGETVPDDESEAVRTHTIRLELADDPGQLLDALAPIAEHGGNLLSVFHERGNVTPRGRIPVEVDIECPQERFETIVEALREAGSTVTQAGSERYGEQSVVLLIGHLVETDLSDTLQRIESCADASIVDVSLVAGEGSDAVSSARLRLAARAGQTGRAIEAVREVAGEKDLRVVEPQGVGV